MGRAESNGDVGELLYGGRAWWSVSLGDRPSLELVLPGRGVRARRSFGSHGVQSRTPGGQRGGRAPPPVDAFLLFLLTIAVTPANVYQFTHDAQMVGAGPPLKYPDSHIVRAGVQVVLLGELWKLAFH